MRVIDRQIRGKLQFDKTRQDILKISMQFYVVSWLVCIFKLNDKCLSNKFKEKRIEINWT